MFGDFVSDSRLRRYGELRGAAEVGRVYHRPESLPGAPGLAHARRHGAG